MPKTILYSEDRLAKQQSILGCAERRPINSHDTITYSQSGKGLLILSNQRLNYGGCNFGF